MVFDLVHVVVDHVDDVHRALVPNCEIGDLSIGPEYFKVS